MRIGFDAHNTFTNISGLGNYCRSMIEVLVKYYNINNNFYMFSGFDENNAQFVIPKGVEVITPSTLIGDIFPSLWRNYAMGSDLRRNKIDIYHGLSNVLPYDIRFGGAKSIVTIHDLAFLKYPNLYPKLDRYTLNKKYRFACNNSDLIVATSEQTKSDIINNWNIADEKVEVVGQACNSIFYNTATEQQKQYVRTKYNLPEKFLLSVGTLEERKNLILTLHAIADGRLDIHLVACGKYTSYAENLVAFVKKAGIEDKVHFIRDIHFSELPIVYQCAEALVYMSLFEGFGLSIVEAFNSKIPVITSSDGVFKETGGDACIYVGQHDLEGMIDAIKSIMTNQEIRSTVIEKGIKRADIYRDDIVAKNLFSIYDKLM